MQKKTKKSEKKRKNEIIDLNFASRCFALKQTLVNWSEAKNLKRKKKRKKVKKSEKMWKIADKSEKKQKKQKNWLEFCFALFRFEAKIT